MSIDSKVFGSVNIVSRKAIPLRSDFNSESLQDVLNSCKVVKQYKRLLAIKVIYDGLSRTEAANLVNISIDVLCYWIKRFNEYGPDGLIDFKSTGRPTKLSKSELKELIQRVRDRQLISDEREVVRLVDLKAYLKRTNDIDVSISALSMMLKREGLHLQSEPTTI